MSQEKTSSLFLDAGNCVVTRLETTASDVLLLDGRECSHMETPENIREPELEPLVRVYF